MSRDSEDSVLREVEVSSIVAASAEDVWARVVSPEGINHELGPWLRMTIPRSLRDATVDTVPLGEPLGRSWILLLGFIPVDFDDLSLAELEPGRRFLERSKLLSASLWEHERTVSATERGTEIRDRLRFQPRVALSGRLMKGIVGVLFRHRHRRLARHFGNVSRTRAMPD